MAMGIELRVYRELQSNGYNNDEIRDYFAENNLDLSVAGNEIAGNPRRQDRMEDQAMEVGAEMRENEPNIGFLGLDRDNEALRGVRDMGGGVVQAGLKIKDAFTGRDEEGDFTDWENQNVASYERKRAERKESEGAEGDDFDWSRLGGQMASSVSPVALGKNMAGKVLLGAEAGALSGAGMFSPSGFASTENLVQTAGGGAGGMAGAALGHYAIPVIKGGVNKFGKMLRYIGNKWSPATADDIGREISKALNGSGVKIGDIPEAHVASVNKVVEDAFNSGSDPAAAARREILRQMGFEGDKAPTRAQLSRDGKIWTREQEAAKVQGAGDQLSERYANQLDYFDKIIGDASEGIGGKSVDDVAAVTSVFDHILKRWKQEQTAVSIGYKLANKKAEGAETTLEAFKSKVDALINLGNEQTTPQVNQALKQIERLGTGADGELTAVNANQMEEMKKALQVGWEGMTRSQRKVVHDLVESLNDDMDKMGNPFREARKFSETTQKLYGGALVKAVRDGKANETNFISTKIFGGKPKDIRNLRNILVSGGGDGLQAWNNVKGRVYEYLMKKSYIGDPKSGMSQFSGAKLASAIDNKESVLKVIFNTDEYKELKNLVFAGEQLFAKRKMSNVNYSNSSSAIANAASSTMKHIPMGQALGRGLRGVGDSFATQQGLGGRLPPMMSPAAEGIGGTVEEMLKRASIPIVPNVLTQEPQR